MDRVNPKSSEQILDAKSNVDFAPIFLALIVGLIIIAIFFVIKKRSSSRRDLLLTGLCDGGKTVTFSQLIHEKACETFTSIAENVGQYECGIGSIKIVDIPGHERLRAKFFDQYKSGAKGIVFVIDSVTLQKDIRDVADYLYTILSDAVASSSHLLILCNKQDETMAKSAAVIKTLLEKEITLVRSTRSSQLQSVDDSETRTVFLGKPGKDFEFAQLSQKVDISECSAQNNELSNLSNWIEKSF